MDRERHTAEQIIAKLREAEVELAKVQTPDEMYFGKGGVVVIGLAAARVRAREERMKANRMATCGVCAGGPDSGALQLQRPECEMS